MPPMLPYSATRLLPRWSLAYIPIVCGLFLGEASVRAGDDWELSEELFVRRVQPLLSEKCWSCHGNDADDIAGGLDLRTRQTALLGGESGEPSIVARKATESSLYLAALRTDDNWSAMPPKEADQLTAEQLDWLKNWIATGAAWPDADRATAIEAANGEKWAFEDGSQVKTSGGQNDQWNNRRYKTDALWAYQPVRRPELAVSGSAAIDALIAELVPARLDLAPAADARTFIRRATFDLTGLPPRPEDVATFMTDYQRDATVAVEQLVDRLLASPHYGERMAQHWLDVVRYADSSGFANDYERGGAWRYRDYVVRAFNDDKPYDQFVRDQIAGDEIDPDDPEAIIATGFLRMGPWELTGMEVAKVARQRFLDDVTNSVGEVFLAHSLQCARCHDHKFDPVPTYDYYAIQSVFATTQLAERPAAFLERENTTGFEERRYLEVRQAEYQQTLVELDEWLLERANQWYSDNNQDPTRWLAAVEQARQQPNSKRPPARRGFSDIFSTARNLMAKAGVAESEYPPKLVGFSPQQFGQERVARKGLERLQWELDRFEPIALAVYNGRTPTVKSVNAPVRIPSDKLNQGELEQTCVLSGGDPFSRGQPVVPGVLSAVQGSQSTAISSGIEGRRTDFAHWIASASNPLTTRAIVNRIWMWHFGTAIAGNPNNFGTTGRPPTHPRLLDWLAAEFVDRGWSFKQLHRTIMLSQAYRRSTLHPRPAELQKLDPLNQSYAVFRPRRLSAEEMRDAMLSVSGELNLTLGGIPNRPEINAEVAMQPRMVMGTFAAAWVPNPLPEQRHRRTLYALKLRGLRDPMLEVFNAPAPDFSCEFRDSSIVTPQVYALLNSQAVAGRALAMAQRVSGGGGDDEEIIAACFELAYGRRPAATEVELCCRYWAELKQLQQGQHVHRVTPPLEVIREAVEENTGERFSFVEKLPAYADFKPDLQPSDCDARTRALADICLMLFNSNEFVYVY